MDEKNVKETANELINLPSNQLQEQFLNDFVTNNSIGALYSLGVEIIKIAESTGDKISKSNAKFNAACNSAISAFKEMMKNGNKDQKYYAADKIMEVLRMLERQTDKTNNRTRVIGAAAVGATSTLGVIGVLTLLYNFFKKP